MAHRNRIGRVSTVAFTLVALALTSGRLRAAPNLVANGDLERPTERAQGVVRGTGDEAIFEFPGEKSFGRVIAHGENLGRQLASDLFVSYTAVGSAGGRTWGFAISGKNVNVDGDYDIAIWFDLKGKIRPNADYAYSVLAIPAGNAIPDLEMIAPAVWADGKLVGGKVTLSWDPEENTADGLVKRGVIRMPDFSVQTGGQALVLKLPKNFKDDLFFDRVSLREIDPALLTDEVPDMPTPTRYVILQDALERQIGEALNGTAATLKQAQNRDGYWDAGDLDSSVAVTATVLTALANRGEDMTAKPMRAGIEWLAEQELAAHETLKDKSPNELISMTWASAARLVFMARYGLPDNTQTVAKDMLWLEDAQFDDGGWADVSNKTNEDRTIHPTNQTSILVATALREAHYAGFKCNRRVWINAARYWTKAQARDGGFRAMIDSYGGLGEPTTTHMTAAGLAGLLITLDMSFAAGGTRCDQYLTKREQVTAIKQSFSWLDAYYDEDFKKSATLGGNIDPFTNATMMQTLSEVAGVTRLNDKDIFPTEAASVLRGYDPGSGAFAGGLANTANMLETLSNGAAAPVFQRIIVGGSEANEYQRDGDHLVWYLRRQRGKPLNWRATNIDTSVRELVKVPMLYLNVAGPMDWDEEDWRKIRDYCFAGGAVICNVDEAARDQQEDLVAGLKKAFPEYELMELPEDDPIMTIRHEIKDLSGVKVIGNGFKNFVFLPPQDWSCQLNLYKIKDHPQPFEFIDNLLAYTRDDTPPRSGFVPSTWELPAAPLMDMAAQRLEVGSDLPAYPDFFKTLDRSMRGGYRLAIHNVDQKGSADKPVLLWLACTGDKPMTDAQRRTVKGAIDQGTYLFAEVVGGDESRVEAFESELLKIDDNLRIDKLLANHPVMTGRIRETQGYDVRQVGLRKALREEYKKLPRPDLYLIERDGEEVGVFSAHDISSGMGYVYFPGCRGVMPENCREIAINVVLHALQRSEDKSLAMGK